MRQASAARAAVQAATGGVKFGISIADTETQMQPTVLRFNLDDFLAASESEVAAAREAQRLLQDIYQTCCSAVEIVTQSQRQKQECGEKMTLAEFLKRIQLKRPAQLAQELTLRGCGTVKQLAAAASSPQIQLLDRLRLHSGECRKLLRALERFEQGRLLWHDSLPRRRMEMTPARKSAAKDSEMRGRQRSKRKKEQKGWFMDCRQRVWFGMRLQGWGLVPSAKITLHDRRACLAKDIREGDHLLSFDMSKGSIGVSLLEATAFTPAWLARQFSKLQQCLPVIMPSEPYSDLPSPVFSITLCSADLQHSVLHVCEDQLLWRASSHEQQSGEVGKPGCGWARVARRGPLPDGSEVGCLSVGDCLVQRDGSECVIVRIQRETSHSSRIAEGGFVHLGIAGPGTFFLDGFLARAGTST